MSFFIDSDFIQEMQMLLYFFHWNIFLLIIFSLSSGILAGNMSKYMVTCFRALDFVQ